VDDGGSAGLDAPGGAERGRRVPAISQETRRAWLPRLKALGNGILPAQSYAIARCILSAEGVMSTRAS
jgi:DNA (cytosine-5)-methyltransferase 1